MARIPMRIVLVSEYFPRSSAAELTGGVEARAFYLARALAPRHEVVVVTSWRDELERSDTIDGVAVQRVGPEHPYSNAGHVRSRLRFAQAAGDAVRSIASADVVDAMNFTVYPHTYGATRAIGARAIATWHEVWLGRWVRHKGVVTGTLGSIWERTSLRKKWDAIVAVSEATRQQLIAHGVDGGRVHVVHNGVDPDLIGSIERPEREPYSICAVGRLIASKRIDTLLDAISLIKQNAPHWLDRLQCHIVGEGDDASRLARRAAERDAQDYFVFHGRLESHAEVMQRIAASSVLVQCSAVEGFGMVLVEANAVGTPFVASGIAPHREVAALLGQANAIVPLDDPATLADAISGHFESQPIQPGDASALTWAHLADKLEAVYSGDASG